MDMLILRGLVIDGKLAKMKAVQAKVCDEYGKTQPKNI